MRRTMLAMSAAALGSATWAQPCDPELQPRGWIAPWGAWGAACPAVDLDDDGDLDVLMPSFDLPAYWMENLGGKPPAFEAHSVGRSLGDISMAAGDLDGDGDLDVAASPFMTWYVWHENLGGSPPTFQSHEVPGVREGFGCEVADIEGDSDADILMSPSGPGALMWLENDGGAPPEFALRTIGGPMLASGFHVVDLEADGDADIVFADLHNDVVGWYENDGQRPPAFTWRELVQGNSEIDVVDMDGDGDPDVLAATPDAAVLWFENVGGSPPTFLEQVAATDAPGISVAALDLDLDRRMDFVLGTPNVHELWAFRNVHGDPPVFERCFVDEEFHYFVVLEGADMDGDDDPDLLARVGGGVFLYENRLCLADWDGDGSVTTRDFSAFLNAWVPRHPSTDLNGDGVVESRDFLMFLNLWVEGCE